MAYKCPTCSKVFRGKKAYQMAMKHCAKKRQAKKGNIPKGQQKKVFTIKLPGKRRK